MSDKQLILVVDDDPDLVDSIAMKLESENYRVAKAYDGEEGWDRMQAEKPALVVLDVMMPRKNGYKLCDDIKKSETYNDVIVILLTAVADAVATTNYTHQDGKNTLADDYIAKPIDLDNLMEIIGDHLN